MEADSTGIRSSWGRELRFDQIIHLDKKKWNNKGIAKIRYDDNGSKRTFVLDDCKFDREPSEQILRLVEANIREDQIVNGAPEPPVEKERSESVEVSESAETSPG